MKEARLIVSEEGIRRDAGWYLSYVKGRSAQLMFTDTVEPGCKDIGLYDTLPITADFLRYQLFLTVNRNIIVLGYNDTRL
jgi:hypothetical protein